MVRLTGKTPLSLDDLCVPDKKRGVTKASAGPALCKSTQFLAPGPTSPLGDSVSSGSGKAFPGRVSASHVLCGSMSAKTSPSRGGGEHLCASGHCHAIFLLVSDLPDVTYLLTFFTVDWNAFHLSVLLGKPQFVVLKNSSQSTWTASSPSPEQEATFSLVWKEPRSATVPSPAPHVSADGGQPPFPHREWPRQSPCAGSSLNINRVLYPGPAKFSPWSPVEQPGWKPLQSRASFGVKGRRCSNENADTTLKYSGLLLGAAIIKREQIKKCLKCKSKGLTVIKMEMAQGGKACNCEISLCRRLSALFCWLFF